MRLLPSSGALRIVGRPAGAALDILPKRQRRDLLQPRKHLGYKTKPRRGDIRIKPFRIYAINVRAVHNTTASNAAKVHGTIWVFTWSIKSVPVLTQLSTVVSEMGEHWSP